MLDKSLNVVAVATKIIQSQMAILGSQIAVAKAQEVAGLSVTSSGMVAGIKGKPREVLQALVSVYSSLSGGIVKDTIKPLVSRFPEIYFDDI